MGTKLLLCEQETMSLLCLVESWQLFSEVTDELQSSGISNVINKVIYTWDLLSTVNSRYLLLFILLSFSCKAILLPHLLTATLGLILLNLLSCCYNFKQKLFFTSDMCYCNFSKLLHCYKLSSVLHVQGIVVHIPCTNLYLVITSKLTCGT